MAAPHNTSLSLAVALNLLLGMVFAAQAQVTYYVDDADGSDGSSGTSAGKRRKQPGLLCLRYLLYNGVEFLIVVPAGVLALQKTAQD